MYRVDGEQQNRVEPIIPPIAPPKGSKFFTQTWSGRLILINTIIFLLVSWESGSLLNPNSETLIRWGAKDNVLLAQGEVWRLLTPIFIHIGLMHFAFNNWALYVLGYQLEYLLKSKWFLLLYLIAGLAGNVASALFSLSISAGASSSLFGILGAGLFLERKIGGMISEKSGGKVRKASVFASMVLINLALGFAIPQIDNAAHLGGLIAGVIFTFALLKLQPNRLVVQKPRQGWMVLIAMCIFLAVGVAFSCSSRYTKYRMKVAIEETDEPAERFYYLSQLIRLDEDDFSARFGRLRLSLLYGEYNLADKDLNALLSAGKISDERWKRLLDELRKLGQKEAALWLEDRLSNRSI